jgi:hypothetical protein
VWSAAAVTSPGPHGPVPVHHRPNLAADASALPRNGIRCSRWRIPSAQRPALMAALRAPATGSSRTAARRTARGFPHQRHAVAARNGSAAAAEAPTAATGGTDDSAAAGLTAWLLEHSKGRLPTRARPRLRRQAARSLLTDARATGHESPTLSLTVVRSPSRSLQPELGGRPYALLRPLCGGRSNSWSVACCSPAAASHDSAFSGGGARYGRPGGGGRGPACGLGQQRRRGLDGVAGRLCMLDVYASSKHCRRLQALNAAPSYTQSVPSPA